MRIWVESLDHLRLAQTELSGELSFFSTSPVAVDHLSRNGIPVTWADADIHSKLDPQLGLAITEAMEALRLELQTATDHLGSRRLSLYVSKSVRFLLDVLCYKRALLENFVKSGTDAVVVGAQMAVPDRPYLIDRSASIAYNLVGDLPVRLLEAPPVPAGIYDADVDQPHPMDRLLSALDPSPVGRLRREMRSRRNALISSENGAGLIWVNKANESILGVLAALHKRGWRIRQLPKSPVGEAGSLPAGLPDHHRIAELLDAACRRRGISLDVTEPARWAARELARDARTWSSSVASGSAQTTELLKEHSAWKRQVIVSSTLSGLGEYIRAEAAEAAGVQTVIFEHGVSAGISRYHEPIMPWNEGLGGSSYLVGSPAAKAFLEPHLSKDGVKIESIGIGELTRKSPIAKLQRVIQRHRLGVSHNTPLIVYLARAPRNNAAKSAYFPSDSELARMQKDIVESLLPRLVGKKLVKLYSTRRYPDGEPYWNQALVPDGVSVQRIGDFRHIRHAADLVICESPLSTLGWAFGAGCPVAYIYDEKATLTEEAKVGLRDSALFFEHSDPNWIEDFTSIVNEPKELDRIWRSKAASRQVFLEEFIFGPPSQGVNGADFIEGISVPERESVSKNGSNAV